MKINPRCIGCVMAAVLVAGSCGRADQPVGPVRNEPVQPSMNSQDTTAKGGVGTLGSGNRGESTTQDGGVGTIGSGN